ncbi:hypothetical protein J2I47_02870 [Fibrella sp. HMF5335]|uniref:Uncharacterized protein n=1 Tax=Fibrella rubiginis TaxID=2817060 RepID=A0A939JZX0_9BACT|nr:hypothetical protein [Fibrella rubiginis]MBO0935482.1 hypothetical protein [Fibrella rubiginis]
MPNTVSYPANYRIQFSVVGSGGNGTVTLDDIVTTNTTVLPVTLVSFSGQPDPEGNMLLNWKTSSEASNRAFVVERSHDLQQWHMLGEIPGAGTSGQSHTYQFIDTQPLRTGYYRLKQIDDNGMFTYSKPIVLISRTKTDPLSISYKANQREVAFQQNPDDIAFPVAVQFYSLSGHLLSTDLVAQPASLFTIAAPSARNPLVIVRVVDAVQQVLVTKRILLTD